ncbi:MAG: hypothetical protein AMXMBFR13_24490 [Phycisphaerae bacterium]
MTLILTEPRLTGLPDLPGRLTAEPGNGSPVQVETLGALRNIRMMHQLERLARAFTAAGLPVMALKGAALNLALYTRPDERPMDDLDLLVHPADAQRAADLLEQVGCLRGEPLVREDFFPRFHYEREFRTGVIHPVKIDLHVRPFRPLRYSRTVPLDALWSKARPVACGTARILIPSAEDMLIHLAAHCAIHGHARRIWLADIHRWVESRSATLNWDQVMQRASAWGLVLPVRAALQRVGREFGVVCPPAVMADFKRVNCGWRERLALRQAPRDANHPLAHVAVNVLCTPGLGYVLAYLLAVVFPGREHMADWYGRKHPGWFLCAHVLRLLGPVLGRFPGFWKRFMRIETRSSGIHGVGVVATRDFRVGELIVRYHGRPVDRHGMYVGHRENNGQQVQHVELTGKLRFLNHSCRPNARLAGFELVAVRPVEAGQEITIDYGPGACRCRSGSGPRTC